MPEIANMIHCPPPWSYVYPKAGIEFREKYLPIIREEKTLNLGMRYTCAIARKDVTEVLHKIPEYRVFLYLLYTKALGYSGIEIYSNCKEYGFAGDETVGAATPKKYFRKTPKRWKICSWCNA